MSSRRRNPVLHAVARGVAWSVGIVLALVGVVLSGPGVLLVGAVTAVVAAAVGRRTGRASRVLARAGALAVVALAACGTVAAVGPIVVPLGVFAAGIAVVMYRTWRRPAPPMPDELTNLSGGQLARDWRISYVRLGQARDADTLGQIVELRRRQLDEIERRDPRGYRQWVSSGNWVRGDSVPFLRG